MAPRAEEIAKQALDLPEDERVELAERLWASVVGEEECGLDEAALREIQRRSEELRSGGVKPVPFEEAMSEAGRMLKARRP